MKSFNSIKSVLLVLFVLLSVDLLSFAASPPSWSGKVVEVYAGDTIVVAHENRKEKVILSEINCPKSDQPFGAIAKKFTTHLSLGKLVTVYPTTIVPNSHIVAHVILPDGHDLNEDLVEVGLAWVFQTDPIKNKLSDIEAQARSIKIGIWSMQNPVPPWESRKGIRQVKEEIQSSNDYISQETLPLSKDEIDISVNQNLKYESDEKERFVIYRGFVVNFNCVKKGPNFTIHKLILEQISSEYGVKVKRRSSFFVDEHNLRACSATNNDYKKSGYDRGHMVPAGDFYWNKLLKHETFVLTNISPQSLNLNRGIWAFLENKIRDKVNQTKHSFYIITGTLYSDIKIDVIGLNKVGIPTSFYKIIYDPISNEMYGFLIDNDSDSYDMPLKNYQVSIDKIEKLTNEDFFDRLPNELEDSIESSIIPFN